MEVYDVAILGAGISGLAAASVLNKEGARCVVLEGRSRHGGRIHTVSLEPGLDIDLGANYLHGCMNEQESQPLFVLASRLDLTTAVCASDIDTPHRGWECPEVAIWRDQFSGERIPQEEVAEMTFLLDRCLVRLLTVRRGQDTSQLDLAWLFDQALQDCLTILYKSGVRETHALAEREKGIFRSLFCRYIAYVNPAYRLSADINLGASYERDADVNLSEDPFFPPPEVKRDYLDRLCRKLELIQRQGSRVEVARRVHRKWEDRLVVGGFGRITDYLARDLDIRYEHVVSTVDWSGVSSRSKGHLQITTTTGVVVRARFCLVTLPVGVLRGLDPRSSVDFVPSLPEDKLTAIRRLSIPRSGAETHNKVILQFRPEDVFWDKDADQLECPDPRLHLLNLHLYNKPGVLMGHLWAGGGLSLLNKTDDSVVDELLALLSGMYPQAVPLPRPVRTLVTRWSEDPFSLGAYTAGEVDSSDVDRKLYAASLPSKSIPRLLFAGEGTVDSSGGQQCTHGAFLSGVQRARDILQALRGSCRVPEKRIVDYLMDPNTQLYPPHPMRRRGMKVAPLSKPRKQKSRTRSRGVRKKTKRPQKTTLSLSINSSGNKKVRQQRQYPSHGMQRRSLLPPSPEDLVVSPDPLAVTVRRDSLVAGTTVSISVSSDSPLIAPSLSRADSLHSSHGDPINVNEDSSTVPAPSLSRADSVFSIEETSALPFT